MATAKASAAEIKKNREKMFATLEKVSAELQKKFGKESVNFLGNKKIEPIPRISTGCMGLDEITGGGYPIARVIEMFGGESSSKTTCCYHAMAQAQKMFPDKFVGFIDSEFCIAKGSFVYNDELGIYEKIEDLAHREFRVISNINGKLVSQQAHAFYVGEKQVYKISCDYNRSLKLTSNHIVQTKRGWVAVADIIIGDVLYTPAYLPVASEENVDDEKYKILGYWLGDGTVSRSEVATVDDFIREDLKVLANKHFDSDISATSTMVRFRRKNIKCYDVSKEFLIEKLEAGLTLGQIGDVVGCSADTIKRRFQEFGLSEFFKLKRNCGRTKNKIILKEDKMRILPEKNDVHKFLETFDVFDKYSYEKYLPSNLTKSQLRFVIAGLFLTDGMVVDSDKQRKNLIAFASSSKKLIYDLQAALLKFGIFSSFYKSVKKKKDEGFYRPCYSLNISGYNDCEKFYNSFGNLLIGYKKERIEKALKNLKKTSNYPKTIVGDVVEVEVCSIEKDSLVDVYDVSVHNDNYDSQNLLVNNLFVHNCFDAEYARSIGVDVSTIMVAQPDSGTDGFAILQGFIEAGASMIVVDSVAAMVPREEVEEEDYGKASVGSQARMMSKALRKLTSIIGRYQCTVIFTNQTRSKIGVSYGNPEVTSGGAALKFYASIRIKFSKIGVNEEGSGEDKEKVSIRVKAEAVKNKTAPPFRKTEYIVTFGKGIDNVESILEKAIERGIIVKKGAWFAYNGQNVSQGRVNLRTYLDEHKEIYDEITEKVKNFISTDFVPTEEEKQDSELTNESVSDEDIGSNLEGQTESGDV